MQIIHQANELGEDSLSLSKRYCEEYLNDMGDLQCRLPTKQPCVSGHMKHITDMITCLFLTGKSYPLYSAKQIPADLKHSNEIINNGCAYVVEGDVFFYVEKSPNYGQLSRQRLENNRAGERVAVDPRKRNPADFALWKAAKPGEKSWDSPWGQGRPGWHIECSAMSARYLTFKFDIHGGGIDLIFPHHENEIAQNRAACQESCVRYWMHNGHVTINNEKMSKSSGNFLTIRQTLLDCEVALFDVFQEDDGEKDRISAPAQLCFKNLQDEFYARMSDDLNTSHLLTGAFQDALKFINSHLNMLKKKQPKNQQLVMIRSLRKIENKIKEVLKVLGLLPRSGFAAVKRQGIKESRTGGAVEADVLFMIEKRTARKNKDFSMTDQIRADLSTRGIALMDVGNETFWRPCVPVCNPTAL
ncbi:cysteine--tRNA ligase 2 cytoplasmic [Citrus sinensis]|nr:cysteine--tRNA ligase 2 cytoplasmic [Citrus sinensis]